MKKIVNLYDQIAKEYTPRYHIEFILFAILAMPILLVMLGIWIINWQVKRFYGWIRT